jgi:hypothetical protein
MNPRRQESTEPRETEAPTLPPKKRTVSDGVKAGMIYQSLVDLDTEEAAELAASPADIRARYAAKRSKLTAEASEAVIALVTRMRGEAT